MRSMTVAAALAAASLAAHAEVSGGAAPSAGPAASAASGVDPAEAARRAVDQAALDNAVRLIRSGRGQEAIDRLLTPLIAARDAEHADPDGPTVYCANSPAESLLYLVQAAGEKRAAIVVDGTWCTALFMRGFAQTDLGRLDQAQADFSRAVAMSPSNPRFLSELGALHARRHEWNEALAFYERAERAAPAFSVPGRANAELGVALRGIGYVDVELGKLDEAEAAYRRCLQIDPNDQKSKAELGYVLGLRTKAPKAS